MSYSNVLYKKVSWLPLAAVVLAVLTLLVLGTSVHAHEGEDHAQAETADSTSEQFVPRSYEYHVETGDNLTVLVRRSLQLFDRATSSVQLSEAQMIFAETCVVQALGSRDLIYPGETIRVNKNLLEQFSTDSQQLSASQLAAWESYVPFVDFDLDDRTPLNVEVSEDGSISDPEAPQDQPSAEQPAEEAGEAADSGSNWYWWFIGAGTVLLLWYLFWKRQDT